MFYITYHLGEGNGTPLQYSCLENPWTEEPGGLQSIVLQERDTTERLNHHHHHRARGILDLPWSTRGLLLGAGKLWFLYQGSNPGALRWER